jgi:predicted DNA-binding transcriptional regulator AlpA
MTRPPKPHRSRSGSVPRTEKTTWTAERIRALGATTNVSTAAEIFGLSRDTGYHLARTGQFPVPVLRIGRQLRVPVAPILTLLGMPTDTPQPPDPATPAGPRDGTGPQSP